MLYFPAKVRKNTIGCTGKSLLFSSLDRSKIRRMFDLCLFCCCLAQASKQMASFLSIHIYHKHLGNMLSYMLHFVAEAVHIFRFRSNPSDNNLRFTNINVRVGDTLVWLTFEQEITGIFEMNAHAIK